MEVESGRAVRRALERAGWRFARQIGSHMVLVKPGPMVSLSIPDHRELTPGSLLALIRATGMAAHEVSQHTWHLLFYKFATQVTSANSSMAAFLLLAENSGCRPFRVTPLKLRRFPC
ncbi:MAG: type II toxin-antitoxin system HicA family toxin [Myxococcales bacterium]|nr:type II toxin-antitoxin system HicA family toxin [Myxococcales bacterium]